MRETSTIYVRIEKDIAARARDFCHESRQPLSRLVEEALSNLLATPAKKGGPRAPKKTKA